MHKNKKWRKREKQEKMKNRRLVKKYPWIAPRDWETGKIDKDYDYSYTYWGLPDGWDKAFGEMYLEELGEAVKDAHAEKDFTIEQIKEKYGMLRVYVNNYNSPINKVIDKYEHISQNVCISCGKPDVPMITSGWISPFCFDCYKKYFNHRNKSEAEIREEYNEFARKNGDIIPDTYKILRFSKDGTQTEIVDVSETVSRIRERWRKRHHG